MDLSSAGIFLPWIPAKLTIFLQPFPISSSAASLPPCLLLHSMAKAAPSGLRSMHTTGNSRFSIFWVEKRPEQRIMPHTLFSLQRFIISTSDFSSPFVTKTIREYPLSLVAFSIQDNKSEKNGWAI